jgi:5-carboxymethyl-2-hydroxymuconate isomerase
MPHLIIEYPGDVVAAAQVEAMVDGVHQAAVATGLFAVSHIRVRALPLRHYRMGGKNDPFIHVQCRIHRGRSDAQKRQLSEALLAAVRAQGLPVKVITVEVVEMDKASYAKWAKG